VSFSLLIYVCFWCIRFNFFCTQLLSDWLRRTPLKCRIFVEFHIKSYSDGQLEVELSSIIYKGWIDIRANWWAELDASAVRMMRCFSGRAECWMCFVEILWRCATGKCLKTRKWYCHVESLWHTPPCHRARSMSGLSIFTPPLTSSHVLTSYLFFQHFECKCDARAQFWWYLPGKHGLIDCLMG